MADDTIFKVHKTTLTADDAEFLSSASTASQLIPNGFKAGSAALATAVNAVLHETSLVTKAFMNWTDSTLQPTANVTTIQSAIDAKIKATKVTNAINADYTTNLGTSTAYYTKASLDTALDAKQNNLSFANGVVNANNVVTNTGVRSVSSSTTNGNISVNTNGNITKVPTYTLPVAAADTLGGIQLGYSSTRQMYGIELSNNKACVYVPWINTTYSCDNSLILTSTTFSITADSFANIGKIRNDTAGKANTAGTADSANKINTDKGDATHPVYFANGIPVQCNDLIANSISGNAASASKVNNALSWSGYNSGSYNGSSGSSFVIPSDNSQLGNGRGYITGITSAMVAALGTLSNNIIGSSGSTDIDTRYSPNGGYSGYLGTILAQTDYAIVFSSCWNYRTVIEFGICYSSGSGSLSFSSSGRVNYFSEYGASVRMVIMQQSSDDSSYPGSSDQRYWNSQKVTGYSQSSFSWNGPSEATKYFWIAIGTW